ncbi:MAG: pteridine reductase [Gammaproteobacteria bacterium]
MTNSPKVVLITGAAQRIGAVIARTLHANGMRVIIHYNTSHTAAAQLAAELNAERPDSALTLQADLTQMVQLPKLIQQAAAQWQRLDGLINNASSFYPTPVGSVTQEQWDDLMASNLRAPFFLSQAAVPFLAQQQGCIINIADIHAQIPMCSYPIYSIAKAGLVMLTKTLAKELGPNIRVNAVSPGAIIWPEGKENVNTASEKAAVIAKTALQRQGSPSDIAKTVLFLLDQADYITGQVIAVDGGRVLNI